MQRIISAFICVMLTACAAINSPSGGEKDKEAPKVLSANPENASTNFDSKQVIIRFNEFIARENFKKKLIISPPVGDDFKVIYKGKRLKLVLPDSLAANTTYSFQFGNSIKDFTEGNELTNYQYVFSTGKELDSLSLGGYVLNAETGLPVEKSWVLLYKEGTSNDSLLLKETAQYITQTNSEGAFRFDYLAEGDYFLYALVDQNGDLRYQSDHEMAGFYSGTVSPDSSTKMVIKAFNEAESFKFLGARYSQYGKVEVKFQGNVDPFEIVLESPEIHYQTWNTSSDSSSIWFDPEGVDSLKVMVQSIKGLDTVSIKTLPFKKRSFQLNQLKDSYHKKEMIVLEASQPFELYDSTGITLQNRGLDTIPYLLNFVDGKGYELNFDRIEEEVYTLSIDPKSYSNYLGDFNDSLSYTFEMNPQAEYSVVVLRIGEEFSANQCILQMINSQGVVAESQIVEKGSTSLTLDYLRPSQYTIRLVIDANANGKWDAGNIVKGIQPETVLLHKGVVKLKANWIVEIDFQASNVNLSESRKKGNFSR